MSAQKTEENLSEHDGLLLDCCRCANRDPEAMFSST